jgi:DNA-3-methyladenine glycosylase II
VREIILIDAVSPFRLDLTVWTLRRRPDNRIDQWDGSTYQRVFLLEDTPVEVSVSQVSQDWEPKIQAAIKYDQPVSDLHNKIREKLDRMLGLKVDLTEFYRMADSDTHLRPLVRYFRGLKPPRYPSIFEALINAIACQQITLTLGIQLLSRLAENFGRPFDPELDNEFAFPLPEDLAGLNTETLQQLGFSRQKSTAIIQLAAALAARPNELEGLSAIDNDQVISKLTGLRGIGRWSAEYALLRGLGRLDVFPTGDVGARKSLGKWLGSPVELDDAAVKQTLDLWQPYSGLIYFHLLLKGLSEKGVLPIPEERNAF